MCIQCTALGRCLLALRGNAPPPVERFDFPFPAAGQPSCLIDFDAAEHLADLLEAVNAENGGTVPALMPILVEGDGNCLFHAVSRALIGHETLYAVLRQAVANELATNRDWHVENVFSGAAEVFDDEMQLASENGTFVPVQHLVALANVIKRPIVLLSSLEEMRLHPEAVGAAVYLPARLDPALCCPNPLLLAWSSPARNHFVPLCRTRGGPAAPTLPPACRPPLGACLPNGHPDFSVERYIPVGYWCLTSTTDEQLPQHALAKSGKYQTFQPRLVQRTAELACATLTAADPVAAATAMVADDFTKTATGGMLAVAACAVLEASRQFYLRSTGGGVPNALFDGICGPEYSKLLAALPRLPAAALRVCVAKEVRDLMCILGIKRQLDADVASSEVQRWLVQQLMQDAQYDLNEAEDDLAVCLIETLAAAAQAQAAQAAQAQAAHAARLERCASDTTRSLLQRLASESRPHPRWAPLGRAVSADDALRPTASAAPLRGTTTWPAHQRAPLGKAVSAPAGASAPLRPTPSAPAAVSLKRGRSASEQSQIAFEALRAKRVHVMALQGQVADAAQPLEALFEQAGLGGDAEADAAAAAEAGPGPHQVVLPEPSADDDDEDSRNLHAALMLSLMGEDA